MADNGFSMKPADLKEKMEQIYEKATTGEIELSDQTKEIIDRFSANIDRATTAFTNLVTCLAINACDTDVDPRYHRKPGTGTGGSMPSPSGGLKWFSGRTISEKVIYPWLDEKGFRTAQSGWQTRTFERPKPYTLTYDENVDFVKDEFLELLDLVHSRTETADNILAYFFQKEIEALQQRQQYEQRFAKFEADTTDPQLIQDITSALEMHFSEGSSARLPVLAVYAIYQTVFTDVAKYKDHELLPLSQHQAADSRTESSGDIEISDSEGDVIEALEVKHNIPIDEVILRTAIRRKILKSVIRRYYILTTHHTCGYVTGDMNEMIKEVFDEHGCQIIINGVIPTIRYYLRLATEPHKILEYYTRLLESDKAVKEHHYQKWSEILRSLGYTLE